MKTVNLRSFTSETSWCVANVAAEALRAKSFRVTRCNFTDSDPTNAPPHAEIVVFPVLGDDRLPPLVEAWLDGNHSSARHHGVIVTGDFTVGERPTSRVAVEAERLLAASGSCSIGAPLLIDTPRTSGWQTSTQAWVRRLTSAELVGTREHASLPRSGVVPPAPWPSATASTEPALRTIVSELPFSPRIEIDRAGRCTLLDLTDGAAYPRSLLATLPVEQRQRLLDSLRELTHLQTLSLAYAGLRSLPVHLPASLVELNLTGNPVENMSVLRQLPLLRSLNVAACNLSEVPSSIRSLRRLDTLIIAKNGIADIPPWFAELEELRRCTFYRNRLVSPLPSLASLRHLEILNIGASPVTRLDANGSPLPSLRALGVCMTSMRRLPNWVLDHPSLERVDVSKNPQLSLPHHNGTASCTFATSMPDWNSYGTHMTTAMTR